MDKSKFLLKPNGSASFNVVRRPGLLMLLLVSIWIAFKTGALEQWFINGLEAVFLSDAGSSGSSNGPYLAVIVLLASGLFLTALRINKLSKALKFSESSFKDFFERSPMPFGLIKEGRFIDINPAALSILKLRNKDRMLSLSFAELSPEYQADGERSHQKAEQNFEISQRKGKHQFEWLHQCSDGEMIRVMAAMTATQIKGQPCFFYAFNDITEQRYCEAALARCHEKMRSFFEDTHEAILLWNNQLFFDANVAALTLFGLSSVEELSAYSLVDLSSLVQPDGTDSADGVDQHIQTGFELGAHQFEWHFRRESEGEFIGNVRLNAFEYDGEPALKISISDITRQKQQERYDVCRARIIESIAKAEPLADILMLLAKSVKFLDSDKSAAILLIDENSQLLILGAAPDLPDFFDASMNPFCYEAIETEQRVIIENIRDFPDTAWPEQNAAIQAGIAAFWVEPIKASSGKALGTFITYHQSACLPNDVDIELTVQNVNLAALAIERSQAAEELRDAALFIKTAIKRWE